MSSTEQSWTNFIPYESTLLSNFVIAMLLMGMNVSIRMVFHNIKGKMLSHEADNKLMKYKMEFLLQISPHFLMNTLNNIHVLVDSDEERPKMPLSACPACCGICCMRVLLTRKFPGKTT